MASLEIETPGLKEPLRILETWHHIAGSGFLKRAQGRQFMAGRKPKMLEKLRVLRKAGLERDRKKRRVKLLE